MKIDAYLALLKGAATYLPGLYSFVARRHMNEGRTAHAEYSYGVWMKHLSLLNKTTNCGVPSVIVELGPGDTMGVGVSALLSGASRYIGVDAIRFARSSCAHDVALGLVDRFNTKLAVKVKGWPNFSSLLDEHGFQSKILDEGVLSKSLDPHRVALILRDLNRVTGGGDVSTPFIDYFVPAPNPGDLDNVADLVMSHSVLEHVVDIRSTMQSAYRWLRPGGLMSHVYDLSAHGIVRSWDGHRAFSDSMWKIVTGTRPFMINRLPHSRIVQEVQLAGFEVLTSERMIAEPTVARSQLCEQWHAYCDEDICTAGGFIQARKPG